MKNILVILTAVVLGLSVSVAILAFSPEGIEVPQQHGGKNLGKVLGDIFDAAKSGVLVNEIECEKVGKTSGGDKIDVCKVGEHVVCLVVQDAGFKCHKRHRPRPFPDPRP